MDPSCASSPRVVVVSSDRPIELCQFLKYADLAGSGGEAKHAITEGRVLLNGVVETRKGKKLAHGDKVTFAGQVAVVNVAA